MYNINSNGLLPVPQGEGAGATPRTPEILNSLMAMTNPFDAMRGGGPRIASSPPSESTSSSCGSSTSPPSVQHTCSQLIKEGLKLTIQTKRRNNPSSSASDDTTSKPPSRNEELTPEDEERRRRRRERNKIAATKCRLKKRERTVNLVQESEILETQNHDLKSQIQDLENERKRLVDMLSVHRPSCSKQLPFNNVVSPSGYQEPYAPCTSSVEPRPSQYTRYSTPFCKVEVHSDSYHKTTNSTVSESSYQRLETFEESGFGRPHGASVLTYHTFEQGVVKEPSTVLPFPRLSGDMSDNYTRIESGYSSLSLESSHSYIRSHVSPTRQYPRPSTLGVTTCSDYESNKEILDSPSIAPSNYHHFDEDADNYSAGFPSGSCIT